jgi:integrase
MPTLITKAIVEKARADQLRGAAEYQMTDARVQGLELRVRPRGVMWNFRRKVAGTSYRLAIASVDLLSIAEARQVATDASAVARAGGVLDQEWMTCRLVELGKIEAAPEPELVLMTFAQGRTAYLEMVEAAKSKGTFDDYRQTLNHPKLACLDDRQLHTISREELAEIVKEVHTDGYETQADHFCRVIRPFWKWLESDAEVRKTGVTPGIMDRLRPPPRTRIDEDDEDDDDERGTYVPSVTEMAEAILAARVAYEPAYAGAIEMLVWTVQRRRAIVEARITDFEPLADGKRGLWKVPASSRKGRKKNGKAKRPHVVPLPEPVWECFLKAARARGDAGSQWLFPAKSKSGHISESTLTHYLSYLPNVKASPHDMRRGFGTHGEALLGLLRAETDFILDHEDEPLRAAEVTHRSQTQASTMTGSSYALHDGTHRTWKIMDAWVDLLQPEMARVYADRPGLFSDWWVKGEVAKNKKLLKSERNRHMDTHLVPTGLTIEAVLKGSRFLAAE